MPGCPTSIKIGCMDTLLLSNGLADAADRTRASVVQVQGRWRPASGVVYAKGLVLTSARALGRDDGLKVRTDDGTEHHADLAGWDPGSGLAVLRAPSVSAPTMALATGPVRVGHLSLAIARSWSNALTVTAGIVSVIGGPLRTGRGGRSGTVSFVLRADA